MITLPGLIPQSPGTASKQVALTAENWPTRRVISNYL